MLTAETIKVHTIDKEKLSQVLNARIQKEHPSDKVYKMRFNLAVITEPKIGLITDECVGWDKQPFDIPVHGEKDLGEGRMSIDVFPEYEFPFYLGDIEPFIGKTMTLKEFMGERYRYNGRIRTNEQLWLQFLSK